MVREREREREGKMVKPGPWHQILYDRQDPDGIDINAALSLLIEGLGLK